MLPLRFAALFLPLLIAAPAGAQPQQPPARQFKQPVIIPFDGPILPHMEMFLYRRLDAAQALGADLVILEIDSPGGLAEESFRIAERLQRLDWARTVAYIPREAISGAAIMALGCDDIVMGPAAQLGDAGVIKMGGEAFEHAEEKLRSYWVGKLRPLAESKGRSPALAEAMMDQHCEVFAATNRKTGKKAYLSRQEILSAPDAADWEQGPLVFESREGVFLTVSGARAIELGLAATTVQSREQLFARYGLQTQPQLLDHTWVDTLAYVLNRPLVTALLLVVGMICLYIEFSAPGTAVGGLLASLCFVLFFWSRALGGTAGWLEVTLFVTGVAFVVVEIFLLPGFGVSGLAGALLIVTSIVLAGQRFVIPKTDYDVDSLLTWLSVMVGSGVGSTVLAVMLRKYFGLFPAFSGMVLQPPTMDAIPVDAPETDWRAALVGQEGMTVTALRPLGRARFGERTVDVVAEGSYILPNKPVRVMAVQGNRIIVVEA